MNKKNISSLDDHLGYWLRCLSNFVSHSFAEKLEKQNISVAQWVVLRTLYDSHDLTLNQAARRVGVDKSSLSRLIERLVQRNLVIRAEGSDRRSVGLSLTVAGTELVPKLAELADENDSTFFSSLSSAQRKEFLATIQKLLMINDWNISTRGQDRME